MPRIVVTRKIPQVGLDMLHRVGDITVLADERPPDRSELLAAVAGCDAILALLTERVDAELLDAAGPQLKVVSNLAVGVDNIDVAECHRRGIPLGHTPDVLTDATADLTWALLLAAARRVVEGAGYVRRGQWKTWDPNLFLGTDVHGTTLGVVGFGRIGRTVARRAGGFDMEVVYHSRSDVKGDYGARPVPFEQLLQVSDYVTIHVPLTEETRHLIDGQALSLMKPTAILVNTARGPVVDPDALRDALVTGQIAAAALDVTDPEPIGPDDVLLALDNCLIVPHIGSASRQARDAMAKLAAANVIAGLEGRPLPREVSHSV